VNSIDAEMAHIDWNLCLCSGSFKEFDAFVEHNCTDFDMQKKKVRSRFLGSLEIHAFKLTQDFI
jgi:hypothetical protein